MTAGQFLLIEHEITGLLTARGILTPAGEIDESKLDSIAEILGLLADIEVLLLKHGVKIPPKVDALLRVITALGPLLGALTK